MNGRSDHSTDEKFRFVMPARFRSLLGTEFILTMGPNRSIRAYPKEVFEQILTLFASRSVADEFDSNSAMLQRMVGNSDTVSLDTQFRITIPKYLREWAQISENQPVAIFGSGYRVEIWSQATWLAYAETTFTDETVRSATQTRMAEMAKNANNEAA